MVLYNLENVYAFAKKPLFTRSSSIFVAYCSLLITVCKVNHHLQTADPENDIFDYSVPTIRSLFHLYLSVHCLSQTSFIIIGVFLWLLWRRITHSQFRVSHVVIVPANFSSDRAKEWGFLDLGSPVHRGVI
jgi:hypothetical protein